jgi:xylulokinase
VTIERAIAVGGGARSERWLGIAADVLGIPIRRSHQPEAACWGAARLAAEGAGLLCAGEATMEQSSSPEILPDPKRSRYYRSRLATYRELYGALQPVNAAL